MKKKLVNPLIVLMILGQLILLAGIVLELMLETGNIETSIGVSLINHTYWGLIATSFLLIIVASYDFIKAALPNIKAPVMEKEDTPIYLGSFMGILGCLFFVGQIYPAGTSAWIGLSLFGIAVILIYLKDLKACHAMLFAVLTIASIVSMQKWSFLEAHANRGKWIIGAMAFTFVMSVIVESWQVRRAKKRNPPSVWADLTKKLTN